MEGMIEEAKDLGIINSNFFERNKDKPIGAIKLALPYIVAMKLSQNVADQLIDKLATNFEAYTGFGADPFTHTIIEEGKKEIKAKVNEEVNKTDDQIIDDYGQGYN
jgi:hypothetical protein